MKTSQVWCVLAVAVAVAALAAEPQAPVEDTILGLQRQWLEAEDRGDLDALRRMFADDFIGLAFGGNVVGKADVIPEHHGAPRMAKGTLKSASVRVFGDTAVAMGGVGVSSPEGPGEFLFTMVYQKRGAEWKIIAAHLSRAAPRQ